MIRNTDILNELKEISPAVADLEAKTPYKVPEGYFDTLADVIMARVIAGGNEESPVISVAGKSIPLTVPNGYFETLSDSILERIKAQKELSPEEELNELSPVLAKLSKTNLYAVPEGYFEGISKAMIEKVTAVGKTKVVTLFTQRKWMNYAAAASVLVMLAFGATYFFSKPAKQLDSYVKLGLKNFKSEQQITNGITSINETDLVTYLQMTADSKDAETIASLVDQTQLPEEADYMDSDFLESFMKELEQTETKTN